MIIQSKLRTKPYHLLSEDLLATLYDVEILF